MYYKSFPVDSDGCHGDPHFKIIQNEQDCEAAFVYFKHIYKPAIEYINGTSIPIARDDRPAGCYGPCDPEKCSLALNPNYDTNHVAKGVHGLTYPQICKRSNQIYIIPQHQKISMV